MRYIYNKKTFAGIILGFFVLLGSFLSLSAHAATLSLVPASGSFTAGNIFKVNVLVDSQNVAVNDADVTIDFPSEFLEVLSVDKSSSIFPLWVEGPSFSNGAGTITFDGGVPTPGFTGTAGKILTIVFEVKKPGLASVIFSSAMVRANDGYGTDVFTGSIPASFTLTEATPASAPATSPNSSVQALNASGQNTQPFSTLQMLVFDYVGQNIITIIIILFLLLLIWYLIRQLSRLEKKMPESTASSEAVLYKDFDYLRTEMADRIAILQSTKEKRPLTEEEATILGKMQAYLDVIEHDLDA